MDLIAIILGLVGLVIGGVIAFVVLNNIDKGKGNSIDRCWLTDRIL